MKSHKSFHMAKKGSSNLNKMVWFDMTFVFVGEEITLFPVAMPLVKD